MTGDAGGGSGSITDDFAAVGTVPAPGADGVVPESSIEIAFSAEPDLATVGTSSFRVELATGGSTPGSYRRGTSPRRIVFRPQAPFPRGAEVVVTLTDAILAKDARALQPHSFRFSIRDPAVEDPGPLEPPAMEQAELVLEAAEPQPGGREVAADALVSLTWSEALDPATATAGSLWLSSDERGRIPAIVELLPPDARVAVIAPQAPFLAGERVRVHVSADLRGAGGATFPGTVLGFRVRGAGAPGAVGVRRAFTTLGAVRCLATGDVNGDAVTDVAYASAQETFVDMLLGDREGNLRLGLRIEVGAEPLALVLADADADGDLDLLVGTALGVSLYANLLETAETQEPGVPGGDPRFAPAVVAAADAPVRSLAVGDLDHVGPPDLVLDTDAGLKVRLGGIGGPDRESLGDARVSSTDIVLADLDGDGWLDIVHGDARSGGVTVCLASETGGGPGSVTWLSAPARIDLEAFVSRVEVADLDADGVADIVAVADDAAAGDTRLRVLYQGGGGIFFEAEPVAEGLPVRSSLGAALALADLDGDGIDDFVLTSPEEDRVVWLPNVEGSAPRSDGARFLLSAPSPRFVRSARLGAAAAGGEEPGGEGETVGAAGGGTDIVAAGGNEIHVLIWAAAAPEPPDGAFEVAVEGVQVRRKDAGASALVRLTNARPLGGYSVALGFDPEAIQPTGVSLEGTATGLAEPEFEVFTRLESGGIASPEGVVYSVILELMEPFEGKSIPAGEDQALFRLLFDVPETAPLGTTEIRFIEDDGPPPIFTELIVEAMAVIPTLVPGAVEILDVVDPPPPPAENRIRLSRTTAAPGGEAVLDIVADALHPIEGFTAVIAYDPAVLEVIEFDLAGTETALKSPDQVIPKIANDEGYSVLTVILDFLPPLDGRAIPAGTGLLLARVRMRVAEGAPSGAQAVSLENEKGRPPLDNIFVVDGGIRVDPELVGGEVQIGGSAVPTFVRGNVDGNSDINLADGLWIANYLFLGGEEPVCLDAADVDDDGKIDLTDPIFLLNHLFLGGPEPPPPYPTPGPDPTPDTLEC